MYLSEGAFAKSNLKKTEAERAVADSLMKDFHMHRVYTRIYLKRGNKCCDWQHAY